jgi:DNA replication protein DnaC
MLIQTELKATLKRLRLSGMLATLPDRLAFARKDKIDYTDFLQLVLSDEIERRDHKRIEIRLQDAGFDEECTLERFDWSSQIRIDKARLMDLFGLHFIERHENIAFSGPVGVGKTYLAQALGHAACRAGYRVLFIRTDALLKALAASRADNSFDRELRRFIAPDLVVIDDFGLRKLSGQASSDFYDLIVERHTRASTLSRPTEPSRNGWLFSMKRFSGKAHWIVSVIAPTSSSLRESRIENEPRLRRKTENQNLGTCRREGSHQAGLCRSPRDHEVSKLAMLQVGCAADRRL